MKQLLPQKYHNYIYIFALILLVVGMPVSKFFMSLSQFILIGNWLFEGDLKNKLQSFFKNKVALVLTSVLALHVLGLLFTDDFAYANNDIRIKLPLVILPLVIATSNPLSRKQIDVILYFFVAAVVFASMVSIMVLNGWINKPVVDIRDISIFISHIRFALLICFAIFVCIYFVRRSTAAHWRLLFTITAVWLFAFLFILQSMTGLAILVIATGVWGFMYLWKTKKIIWRVLTILVVLVSFSSLIWFINKIKNIQAHQQKPAATEMLAATERGNPYKHDANGTLQENGHFIWINVCDKELEEAWNKRSEFKFWEGDSKGNPLRYTLIRFLASKGLNKDWKGVMALSSTEIKAIERGVPNVNYQNISGLQSRVLQTFWEIDMYKSTGDANGHSLTQRFEYWIASWNIIQNNLLFGVGTGDLEQELFKQYDQMNSKLSIEYRLHPHNQFLSIMLCFGIIGLIWFLFSLFYPMFAYKKYSDYLYVAFMVIAACSFFTEDTLETQAGVTFYAFLNSFLLFVDRDKQGTTIE